MLRAAPHNIPAQVTIVDLTCPAEEMIIVVNLLKIKQRESSEHLEKIIPVCITLLSGIQAESHGNPLNGINSMNSTYMTGYDGQYQEQIFIAASWDNTCCSDATYQQENMANMTRSTRRYPLQELLKRNY